MNHPDYWQRSRQLIGDEGLARLTAAHVIVAGLGGVGSYAVEALARAGVGHLSLIDGDTLAASNLNRQLFALRSTLGLPKVQAAAARVQDINPLCRLRLYPTWITPGNAASFLTAEDAEGVPPGYLLDAIDDLPAKTALLAAAVGLGLPVISVLGTGNRLHPFAQYQLADIHKTHTCPLARALRKRLRAEGIERGVQVIFSPLPSLGNGATEEVSADEDPAPLPKKQPPGSMSYLPGQAGLLAAGVIIETLIQA